MHAWALLKQFVHSCTVQERVERFKQQFSRTRELDQFSSTAAGLSMPVYYGVSAVAVAVAAVAGHTVGSKAPLEGELPRCITSFTRFSSTTFVVHCIYGFCSEGGTLVNGHRRLFQAVSPQRIATASQPTAARTVSIATGRMPVLLRCGVL